MKLKLFMLAALAGGSFAHDAKGKSHAPASAKAMTSPLSPAEAKPELGRANFLSKCAGCHNPKSKAPKLASPHVRSLKDGEIYWVITNGVGNTMPGFKGELDEVQRWQIVHYVRSLKR